MAIGKILRAPFTLPLVVADRFLWPFWLRLKGVQYGPGLRLEGRPAVRMAPGGEIRLGSRVDLLSRPQSNPLQIASRCALCLVKPQAVISIGDDCGLSGTVIVAATSVQIGHRVLVGANSRIVDTDFHPLYPEDRRRDRNAGVSKPVVIGDDVFIGMNALILKGATLGDGCVVGAGAVVSGAFPPCSVIAGNPAKIIKQLPGARDEG